jgi:hypothetical protein
MKSMKEESKERRNPYGKKKEKPKKKKRED